MKLACLNLNGVFLTSIPQLINPSVDTTITYRFGTFCNSTKLREKTNCLIIKKTSYLADTLSL